MDPARRSREKPIKTVFVGFLGCRSTRIQAETTPVEQVRLAVRLAVQPSTTSVHSDQPTTGEAYPPQGEDQVEVQVRNDVGFGI